eukprot:1159167-Pelagomonas_calceolata.AAC.12
MWTIVDKKQLVNNSLKRSMKRSLYFLRGSPGSNQVEESIYIVLDFFNTLTHLNHPAIYKIQPSSRGHGERKKRNRKIT